MKSGMLYRWVLCFVLDAVALSLASDATALLYHGALDHAWGYCLLLGIYFNSVGVPSEHLGNTFEYCMARTMMAVDYLRIPRANAMEIVSGCVCVIVTFCFAALSVCSEKMMISGIVARNAFDLSFVFFLFSWICAGAISFSIGCLREVCRWQLSAKESLSLIHISEPTRPY